MTELNNQQMEEFRKIHATVVRGHEGGWSDRKADYGKETFKGVSRRFFPNNEIWPIIDKAKQTYGDRFKAIIEKDPILDEMVEKFYLKEFYLKLNLHLFPLYIAGEMYDNAVNMGTGRAVQFLQRALNILNQNQRYYPDIKVDGGLGPKTMDTLNKCLKVNSDYPRRLFNVLNVIQGAFYLERMEADSTQEENYGWFERVELRHKIL